MHEEHVRMVGDYIASGWGAYMTSYEELKDGTMRFFCIEHGEEFYTDLSKKEYLRHLNELLKARDDKNYIMSII